MKAMLRLAASVAIVITVILAVTVQAEPQPPVLKAGFAERDITPKLGMEMPGGYGKAFHQKLHDPCKVRAVVFDDGAKRVALVSVDALMVPRHLVIAARKEIKDKCDIAPEAVMVAASHSHSSGPTGMVQPGEYDHASPLAKKLAYEQSSCAEAAYLDQVRREIVAAVEQANAARTDARWAVGSGIEDKAAFNRRFHMKNGLTFTHPGRGNPDIVGVAGPIDPQVGVIGVWGTNGELVGCIVNYACHATTSPPGISANWIYYLERTIRAVMGDKVIVVFLQGFSGDVTQVDNLGKSQERPGDEAARFIGGRLGAEVVKVLLGVEWGTSMPLDAGSRVLNLPRRKPSAARVKESLELVRKDAAVVGHAPWTFAKEIVLLDALLAREPSVEAEVQAIQLGPAILLSMPGEVFCQFGLDMKAASRFPFTFPVELANGCVGYVTTEEALGKHGGGYETRLTSYTNLQPDAGRKMMTVALDLAGQMKAGPMVSTRPAPPFKAPWSYGNVPPELN